MRKASPSSTSRSTKATAVGATTVCAIGLGSNLGVRGALLDAAVVEIVRRVGPVHAISRYYQTAPWGSSAVATFPYLNAALLCATGLSPKPVLDALLAIERAAGRERSGANAPRTLDLDLLFYGSETGDDPALTLPHPRLHLRNFVLEPLAEIAPDWRHPKLDKTVLRLREECPDTLAATPLTR